MAERERHEGSEYTAGWELSVNEPIHSEMAFLAENPEAFGLVPDACPLATKHLLIAANGHSNEGGGSSLVYDMVHPGADGLREFYGKLLPDDRESVRSVYANALLVMLPLSALTLFRYISGGALTRESMGINSYLVLLGAMAGGIIGGVVLGKLGGRKIKRLFALLTLISGVIMVVR
jgi:hypothetical protein